MLYVSTRNTTDAFTANRALREAKAPDGGFYVPFRVTAFSEKEIRTMKQLSTGETIAGVLNFFFGLHLSGWDVDCVIGRFPFQTLPMNHRLIMAEAWHNPKGCWDYLLHNLYGLMLGNPNSTEVPTGWTLIATEIALLFGLFSSMDGSHDQQLDIAVTAGDFSIVIAILYAKEMGLPVNLAICGVNENSAVWDFINKGELSTGTAVIKTVLPELDIPIPLYLEYLIFKTLGAAEAQRYAEISLRKLNYYINDEQLFCMNRDLFAAVVSTNRINLLQTSIFRSNQYNIAPHTAVAYGGLQDYRARTGVSKETIVLAKYRPE